MKTLSLIILVCAVACTAPSEEASETSVMSETVSEAAVTETTSETATTATPAPTTTATEKPMTSYADKVVVLKTSKGDITIRFFPDIAPNHVKNFIDLSSEGFYDGVKFHRVVPGFVIQGGDPNTKTENRGSWGTGGSGRNVKAEFNKVHHGRGILSMARSNDPNSASSQFFIVVKDAGFLDNQYTVFGEVTEGMDVVDKIVADAGGREMPANPVTIQSATVRPATAKEKGPTPK